MKSLKEALIDYDLAQLQGLAFKRGIEVPQNRSAEAVDALVEALLSPVSLAIALDDLSAEERAALDHLLSLGNQTEAHKFARLYGVIRAMGPNRLLREEPWHSPANPAEGLWYRALIFKGFQQRVNGPEEIVYIPDDLPIDLPDIPDAVPPFQISLATTPAFIQESGASIREDLFTLLVYLQTNLVRLDANQHIPDRHRQQLAGLLLTPHYTYQIDDQPDPPFVLAADDWLTFLLHVAHRLNLLERQNQRLRLNAETARDWLQMTAWEQIRHLQDGWRGDPTWNDLWHVPGLYPKATGWENSPLLGRSKIMAYLRQVPPEEWVSFNSFVQAIKTTEPDFQRPDGNFQSWYIYDQDDQPLMGFEHWDTVEGGLVHYVVGTILFAMGVIDLGAAAETLPPTTFRVTSLGQAFLQPEAIQPPEPDRPGALRINASEYTVRVPQTVSLYDRFQLARFATLLRREEKRVIYQINQESYRKALEQSITLEQVLAFLTRATRAQVPLALVEAMRNWDRRSGSVKIERLTVLRVNQESLAAELINHREIGPLLGPPLDKLAILVPEKNLAALRKLLLELGYLEN